MGGNQLTFTLSVTTRDPLSQSSNQRQERSVEDSLVSHGLVARSLAVTPVRICSQWTTKQSTWTMAPIYYHLSIQFIVQIIFKWIVDGEISE